MPAARTTPLINQWCRHETPPTINICRCQLYFHIIIFFVCFCFKLQTIFFSFSGSNYAHWTSFLNFAFVYCVGLKRYLNNKNKKKSILLFIVLLSLHCSTRLCCQCSHTTRRQFTRFVVALTINQIWIQQNIIYFLKKNCKYNVKLPNNHARHWLINEGNPGVSTFGREGLRIDFDSLLKKINKIKLQVDEETK